MATLQFGTALYHSKYHVSSNTATGQAFRYGPTDVARYSSAVISGLISGRNVGGFEDYTYGVEIEAEPIGRTGTFNANGVQLHPIINFNTTKALPVFERYLAGGPAGSTILNIYTGNKPVSCDEVLNLNDYSQDLLISFSIPEGIKGIRCVTHDLYNASNITINSTFKNPGIISFILGICSTKTAAIKSGIATWFWFGNSSNPTNLSDISFVIGSIGQIDDGTCEMLMADNNVELGQFYTSSGFKFEFPSEITI